MKKIIAFALALSLVVMLCGCSVTIGGETERVSAFYSEPIEEIYQSQPDCRVIIGNEENLFDVSKYGATADGKADDTAAVKSALDAATAAGGILYFGGTGKYVINDDITVPENVAFAVATTARVTVSANKTLKINSKDVYIPKKPVLLVKGTVDFTDGINYAFPEWFSGSFDEELQAAIISADNIYLMRSTYKLEKEVTIPQERDIAIHGQSSFGSIIYTNISDTEPHYACLSYVYESGRASTITLTHFKISDETTSEASFLYYRGNPETNEGKVSAESLYVYNIGWIADVAHATGCGFHGIYTAWAGYVARLGAGTYDTSFTRVLVSSSHGGVLVADGLNEDGSRSNGISFADVTSVYSTTIDYDIRNFNDVNLYHSSEDLSIGLKNEAGYRFENVDRFSIIRCWCASNGGISYNNSPTTPYAATRKGVYAINCKDSTIAGSSIENHLDGIYLDGCENITIEGNSLQGNGGSEITVKDSKNIAIHGNMMYSCNQYDRFNTAYRRPGGNYCLVDLGGNTNLDVRFNYFSVRRNDDAILKLQK